MNVENTWNIFMFASALKKNTLISILCADIADQFGTFARTEQFLKIPFDDLNLILDRYSSLPTRDEELLLSTVLRWVCHSREERWQYIDLLFMKIQMSDLSPEYTNFMLHQLLKESDPVKLSKMMERVCYDNIVAIPRGSGPMMKNHLHLYVKYAERNEQNVLTMFSVSNDNDCYVTDRISLANDNHLIRSVALDDFHLYSLHYGGKEQSFRVYNSADMRSSVASLNSPPVNFEDVTLCPLQSKIYAFSHGLPSLINAATRPKNSWKFSIEEIGRGIYVYNCDLDSWFPVPAMKNPLKNSCVLALSLIHI